MSGERALFSDRVRAIVTAIAVLSLVATVGALVFGRRLAPPPAQVCDSYGAGPLGHRAFLEALREMGVTVERWSHPDWEHVSAPLFVIEPNQPHVTVQGHTTTLGELVRARMTAQRPTILVLPKWQPGPLGMMTDQPQYQLYDLLDELPLHLTIVRQPLDDAWTTIEAREPDGGQRRIELRWPQRLEGGVPILADDVGSFVVADPKGLLFVVSDPDLLHSFNLQRGDHAAFWRSFVEERLGSADGAGGDAIVIDEVFHGAVITRSLAELFGRWPGVLVLVHAALIALVLLAMGRKRFGPPAPVQEALGRGPREVIDVAASVLANGSSLPALATRYVEDLVGDLHRRLGLTEGKTIEQRADLVDRAAALRHVQPRAALLLHATRAAGPQGKRMSAREALSIARQAAEFRAAVLEAGKRPAKTTKTPIQAREERA
ncbi:MAG: DUF4350 domain-containing protein [Myxococcota bacterium]|nr:DUF4350 domain-containing protein [Myxococcota bacterium]